MSKVTLVGAGGVGSQIAAYLALKNCADEIVLVDIVEGVPQGKALDLQQSCALTNSNVKIIGSNDYAPTKDSDVVVITAGLPRKPGMSRDDLVEVNSKIITAVISEVIKYSPNSILILVTNPLDAMVKLAYQLSGFQKHRVMGMAGVLDSSRFKTLLALESGAKMENVEAMVLGGHGDSMVPVISNCKINGTPITKIISAEKISQIVEKTRNGGAEIINLLKNGSTIFAPALSIAEMVDTILTDNKKILPCSVLLEGEYGINDLFIGVPVRLGRNGVEEIIELKLTEDEKEAFQKSVQHIQQLTAKIKT